LIADTAPPGRAAWGDFVLRPEDNGGRAGDIFGKLR